MKCVFLVVSPSVHSTEGALPLWKTHMAHCMQPKEEERVAESRMGEMTASHSGYFGVLITQQFYLKTVSLLFMYENHS